MKQQTTNRTMYDRNQPNETTDNKLNREQQQSTYETTDNKPNHVRQQSI